MVKNPLAMQETWVQYLGQEDPLEEGMATCSSSLAWRIPRTEEAGWLQFIFRVAKGQTRLRTRGSLTNYLYIIDATITSDLCHQRPYVLDKNSGTGEENSFLLRACQFSRALHEVHQLIFISITTLMLA